MQASFVLVAVFPLLSTTLTSRLNCIWVIIVFLFHKKLLLPTKEAAVTKTMKWYKLRNGLEGGCLKCHLRRKKKNSQNTLISFSALKAKSLAYYCDGYLLYTRTQYNTAAPNVAALNLS